MKKLKWPYGINKSLCLFGAVLAVATAIMHAVDSNLNCTGAWSVAALWATTAFIKTPADQ